MSLITQIGVFVDKLISYFVSERTRSYLQGVDRFQRYLPVAEKIRKSDSVLDVGGGGGEILKFLENRNITVLDPCFKDLFGFDSKKVCGDGCLLPFKDNSFDIVISVASLEHVPSSLRTNYV